MANKMRRTCIICLLLAVPTIGISLAIVSLGRRISTCSWVRPVPLKGLPEVSKVTGLSFPRSARVLDGERLGGLSPYLIAKVEMTRSEASEFLLQPSLRTQI